MDLGIGKALSIWVGVSSERYGKGAFVGIALEIVYKSVLTLATLASVVMVAVRSRRSMKAFTCMSLTTRGS